MVPRVFRLVAYGGPFALYSPMKVVLRPELIRDAVVDREPRAIRQLVVGLTPIIQCHVARFLFRHSKAAAGRNVRQEIEDVTQEVFEKLLLDGGRRLLAWSPEQGSAFAFFGLLTQRFAINIFESRRRNPWTEFPVEVAALDSRSHNDNDLERLVSSRQMLRAVGKRLLSDLSERDQRLFRLKYIYQQNSEAIQMKLNMSRDAYYQACRRLKLRVRAIYRDLYEAELEAGEMLSGTTPSPTSRDGITSASVPTTASGVPAVGLS